MARRKKRTTRRSFKLPIAAVGGFIPLVAGTVGNMQSMGAVEGLKSSTSLIMPYDASTGRFTMSGLGRGLLPIMLGFVVHKLIGGSLGVNKMLAAARVPVIRL
jgi:hypothetical protein